jgi:dnd system-associated protein 4
MPHIRFPKTGEGLVRYLFTANMPPQNAIFETGAHLVAFAAGLGFLRKDKDNEFTPVLDRPQPIDLNIFKSQGLYEALEIMAIADTGSHEIVDREKELCELVEKYASAGFKHLQAMHNECDGAFFYRQLVQQLEIALPDKKSKSTA